MAGLKLIIEGEREEGGKMGRRGGGKRDREQQMKQILNNY